MTFSSIFFYVISLTLASATIYLSYSLYRNYRLKYLSYWFYFIILLNLGFFFFYTFRSLILDLLKLDPWQTLKFYIFLFVFLLRPIIIIGLFLFIKFVAGLLKKRVTRSVKTGYLLFCILHTLILLALTLDYFKTQETHTLEIIKFLSDWITILALYTGIGYILFRTKEIKEPDQQMSIKMFSYIFFASQTIFILTTNYSMKLLLSFAYILPPLLYLRMYLKKYFKEYSFILKNEAQAGELFTKYNITAREQELIYLICKGKSNQEISETLFISLQTVKHHIHSVYRKLKIKNRVQLTNFFQNLNHPET